MQNILDKIDEVLKSYLATSVPSFDLIQKGHPDVQQILKLFWMNQYNLGFYQDVLRNLMRVVISNQKEIIDNQKTILCKKQRKRKRRRHESVRKK